MVWTVLWFVGAGLEFVFALVLYYHPPLARFIGLKKGRWAYHSWSFFLLAGGVFLAIGVESLFESSSPWQMVFWLLAFLGMVASALIDYAWRKRRAARG